MNLQQEVDSLAVVNALADLRHPEGIVCGGNLIRKAEVASSVGVRKDVLGDTEQRGACSVDGGRCLVNEAGASRC